MPALSRDMALDIPETDPIFFINAGHRKEKPLHSSEWPDNVRRVSMMRNDFKELAIGLSEYPQLCSLLLQYNSLESNHVCEDNFFVGLPKLKLLDLSYTGIQGLPDSLSSLKELRALILRCCWNLKYLPSMSALLELLVLDLTDTHIQQLPEGMEELTKLRRLSLTRTGIHHLVFNASFIHALKKLEELLVDGCGFLWHVESINELIRLRRLLVLEVNFLNTQAYNKCFLDDQPYDLRRFKVSVGGCYDGNLGNNSVAFLGELPANGEPFRLPNDISELHIIKCNDVIKLPGFDAKHLKILEVSDCSNLECLFEMGMMQHLENIHEIIVERCPRMVALLRHETAEDHVELVNLPQLQNLVLRDLEKLECIYDGRVVECNSLTTIIVWGCPHLKKFPIWAEGLKDLVEIHAESVWFEALTNPPTEKDLLRPFLKEYMPGEESYRSAKAQFISRSNHLIEESPKSTGTSSVNDDQPTSST